MATSDYLDQLQTDKQTLVTNLNAKGVEATNDETFTTLVPKVAEIQGEKFAPPYVRFQSYKGSSIDLINLDTSNVTNMSYMFYACSELISLDVSNFNTSNVTDMSSMFQGCNKLAALDLSSFDTSNIKDTNSMFQYCNVLEKLIINNNKIFKLLSSNAFTGTPIKNGTGYVYVPDDMVDTYKAATNWSAIADQIKPISEMSTE